METVSREQNVLDRIVEKRRESISHRKRVLPEVALKLAVEKAGPPRDFPGALTRAEFNIVAELKKASPSRGLIRQNYAPAELAPLVERAGAAALSVLTEEDFFLGSLADLKAARKAVQIPVLRKDFVIDPWQVWESRAAGADTFLLIVAILGDDSLRDLLELGRALKTEPLVEVHSRAELDRAISAGAQIIGVNNRDLRDFSVRIETSLELIDSIPDDCIAVSESGLRSHDDLARLRRAGFDAFLIGERLMDSADPAAPLQALRGAGSNGQSV
jgi:indole-3-glycerol phosphate synthase